MRAFTITTSCMLTGLLTTVAGAGVIQISNNTSESFLLNSHPLGDLFGSDVSPDFSTTQLAAVHSSLLDFGINTDGKITILPVDTNQGLSFLTLVDQELGGGDSGFDGILGVSSTGSETMGLYINDEGLDAWSLIQSPFIPSQTLGATFIWGSIESGDAFAWTNLVLGDAIAYTFEDLDGLGGAIDADSFQFVGWEEEGWEIISTNGFKVDGSSVFTGIVIPAPPVLLLFSVGALGFHRRRPTR